jgi:hypothetical protein
MDACEERLHRCFHDVDSRRDDPLILTAHSAQPIGLLLRCCFNHIDARELTVRLPSGNVDFPGSIHFPPISIALLICGALCCGTAGGLTVAPDVFMANPLQNDFSEW